MNAGCHYLTRVKGNTALLLQRIISYADSVEPLSVYECKDDKHGRRVTRRTELYDNGAQIPEGWNGIQRIVKVRRYGVRKGKSFDECAFYILSKPIDCAETVAQAVRGHWAIENKLHWVKDVNLGEDFMTLRNTESIALLVYLNNIALTALRCAGYNPIKDTLAKFANKVKELIKVVIPVVKK